MYLKNCCVSDDSHPDVPLNVLEQDYSGFFLCHRIVLYKKEECLERREMEGSQYMGKK